MIISGMNKNEKPNKQKKYKKMEDCMENQNKFVAATRLAGSGMIIANTVTS